MSIRTDSSPRVTTTPMSSRVTASPSDRRFREALGDGARLLLGGVESAARALPGGSLVAAAIGGTGRLASTAASAEPSSGGLGSAEALGGEALLGSSNDAMALIALQQQMQDENRRYTTLSNVLKARHETAKNAIGNIR